MGNSAGETTVRERSHWPVSIFSTATAVFNLFIPLVLVRLLTPLEVGAFKIFFLYLFLAPVVTLTVGVQNGLAFWSGSSQAKDSAFHASALLLLMAASVAFALAWAGDEFVTAAIGVDKDFGILFALGVFGAVGAGFFEEAAIARGYVWTGALYNAGFELVRTVAIVAAAWGWSSLYAVCVAHVCATVARVAVGYLWGWRLGLVGWSFSPEIFKRVWRYAFPVSLAWLFGVFVTHIDQMILSQQIAPADFAIYSIGCLAVPPLLILERSVNRVLIPQMAHALAERQESRAVRLFRDAVKTLGFFFIPAVAGLVTFATPIISVLFTPAYEPASHYLRLFAFSYLLLLIPYDATARASGDASWIMRSLTGCSVISVLITLSFTVLGGSWGALAGVLVSSALLRSVGLRYSIARLRTGITTLLPVPDLCRYAISSVGLSAAAAAVEPAFESRIVWMLVCGPLFLAAYMLLNAFHARRMPVKDRHPARMAVVLQRIDVGGLERMVHQLCRGLRESGKFAPVVFAYDQPPGTERSELILSFERDGIPVSACSKRRGFSFAFLARLIGTLWTQPVAFVHCHDLGGLIYCAIAKIVCLGKFRLTITQHSFIHLEKNRRYGIYERWFTAIADDVVVVSDALIPTYQELGVNVDRIVHIPNGVSFLDERTGDSQSAARANLSASMGEARPVLAQSPFWLLYLARLFPQKGQLGALELWEALSESIRLRSALIFVGPATDSQYDAAVRERALRVPNPERVVFAGPSAKPHHWLHAASLYLSCSEFEGMPLGPLEAAGSGVPTVLSDIPGHRMLGDGVKRYPLTNHAAGARIIEGLLEKGEGCSDQSMRDLYHAAEALREHFSVRRMVRLYSQLFLGAPGQVDPTVVSLELVPVAEG